jgi:nucleoside-diphosphate-sugar epimerase
MRMTATCSTGKIGREAVAALKRAGHRVVGLDLHAGTGVRTVM